MVNDVDRFHVFLLSSSVTLMYKFGHYSEDEDRVTVLSYLSSFLFFNYTSPNIIKGRFKMHILNLNNLFM